MTYIQLCEVLWKQNAGTKEQKKKAWGLRPRASGERPAAAAERLPWPLRLGQFLQPPSRPRHRQILQRSMRTGSWGRSGARA
jgi:hypothetical protein